MSSARCSSESSYLEVVAAIDHQSLRSASVEIKIPRIANTGEDFKKANSLLLIRSSFLGTHYGLLGLVLNVAEFDREFAFRSAPTNQEDDSDRAKQSCGALHMEEEGPPHCHTGKVRWSSGSHACSEGCHRREENHDPFDLLTVARHR